VLEGSIKLVFGADRCTYRPGDACNVPAGTMHEEHTEADGVRHLAGRRPAAQNVTAESHTYSIASVANTIFPESTLRRNGPDDFYRVSSSC
jgi:hypothetical protein